MRVLISLPGVIRLIALGFALGIIVGLYVGIVGAAGAGVGECDATAVERCATPPADENGDNAKLADRLAP